MGDSRMSKLFSIRSRKNLRPSDGNITFMPPMPAPQEPVLNLNSADDYDASLKARNLFVQERQTYLQREEEEKRQADEQIKRAEEHRVRLELENRRNEEYRRQVEEQRRRNEIAKREAIKRNEKVAAEAARHREAEQVKLAEQAEVARREVERKQNASAESVRRLRELMRKKYSLDVYIWSKRRVQKANRPLIVEKYLESDRILQEILFIVNAWDESLFNDDEWRVAKKIKSSFDGEPQYPIWADVPPWDPRRDGRQAKVGVENFVVELA